MQLQPRIAIVGYGNLGRTLAGALRRKGYPVEVVRRGQIPKHSVDILWLCVPDKEIASVARDLAKKMDFAPRFVLHASGALPAAILRPLKRKGTAVASAHPLNTFVAAAPTSFRGVPFGVEGDAAAVRLATRIAKDLTMNGPVFRIAAKDKPMYHAMGAFASPLLIALLANAEIVGKNAGIRDPRRALAAILQTTIDNYRRHGAAASFGGPIARGDAVTVKKHLEVLKSLPRQRAVYRVLAESALQLLPTKLSKI